MSDVVIRAEGLGKKYLIGHQAANAGYVALRDVVAQTAKGLVRSARDMLNGRQLIAGDEVEEFWALKDINFEIKRGDVVGIIGRNGAGKSTLLKILSRITEPSTGRVEIKGRVASLLEVGTGFHPELTGRENIFLNGAILGMSRAEIKRKFDEIVAFAEVERFLDTPVKRYSSGMYVRLAFAVAAHLEPEILIIDEVLAVGDAEFQNKCLGKMGEVAGQGRTVLFVSHNLTAVQHLCKNGVALSGGEVEGIGPIGSIIEQYKRTFADFKSNKGSVRINSDVAWILEARLDQNIVRDEANILLDIRIKSNRRFTGKLDCFIVDGLRNPIGAMSVGGMGALSGMSIESGVSSISLNIDIPRLAKGHYFINIQLSDRNGNVLSRIDDISHLQVDPFPQKGESEVLDQEWGFGSIWLRHSVPESGSMTLRCHHE